MSFLDFLNNSNLAYAQLNSSEEEIVGGIDPKDDPNWVLEWSSCVKEDSSDPVDSDALGGAQQAIDCLRECIKFINSGSTIANRDQLQQALKKYKANIQVLKKSTGKNFETSLTFAKVDEMIDRLSLLNQSEIDIHELMSIKGLLKLHKRELSDLLNNQERKSEKILSL
jgi:hypothetical protein